MCWCFIHYCTLLVLLLCYVFIVCQRCTRQQPQIWNLLGAVISMSGNHECATGVLKVLDVSWILIRNGFELRESTLICQLEYYCFFEVLAPVYWDVEKYQIEKTPVGGSCDEDEGWKGGLESTERIRSKNREKQISMARWGFLVKFWNWVGKPRLLT